MPHRALPLLLSLVCTPASSYLLSPARLLLSGRRRGEQAAKSRDLSKPVGGALISRASRLRFSDNSTSRSSPGIPPSSDTVSCLKNPETGARVWLVGIVHEATPYVELIFDVIPLNDHRPDTAVASKTEETELVKRTIREVQPGVVMLELDAESIFLLPKGRARQGHNGLWWWEPEPETRANSARASPRRRNKSKPRRRSAVDSAADVDEIWAAGLEAQACGARVLLGDRSSRISKEREAEANHADSEMLRELSKGFGEKRRRLERAGEGLQVLMAIIERRRDSGWEMPECRAIVSKHSELHRLLGPRVFDVTIIERDEVMAKNLMALDGRQTIVAVLGSAHLDGMESILLANGWLKADQQHSLASDG